MEEGSFQNTVESIEKHFANIPPARIAMEVGGQSSWISRELKKYGHEVLVANARICEESAKVIGRMTATMPKS